MRALRCDGRSVRLATDAPEPAPAPGEALVRISRMLVGPSDAAAAERGFSGILGSQFVGVIKQINLPADVGPVLAARKGWAGKRVTASPTIACGSCDLCHRGLSAHCRARTVMGVHGRDGCFADLVRVPLSSLCLVPDSVKDDDAVFAHALSGALHAAHMLRSEGASFITVLGDSAAALLTAQVLARMNKTVRVLTSRPDRQRLCEKWGIKHRAMDEAGRRQDQDVVVDCTGASSGLRLALQFVRPRGTVLLKSPLALAPFPAGRPFPDVAIDSAWATPVDFTPAIVNEVQIAGSRDGPVPDALRMLSEGVIDVASLVGRRFKLNDAPEALKHAAAADALAVMLEV